MALSAEHRSKFAALHRNWWRLHTSEKFSSGTKNPQTNKQTNKQNKTKPLVRLDSMVLAILNSLHEFYSPCFVLLRNVIYSNSYSEFDLKVFHRKDVANPYDVSFVSFFREHAWYLNK